MYCSCIDDDNRTLANTHTTARVQVTPPEEPLPVLGVPCISNSGGGGMLPTSIFGPGPSGGGMIGSHRSLIEAMNNAGGGGASGSGGSISGSGGGNNSSLDSPNNPNIILPAPLGSQQQLNADDRSGSGSGQQQQQQQAQMGPSPQHLQGTIV